MKNGDRFSENQTKALLSRLKDSKVEYPAALLANRRKAFLGQVPVAGILIGNKAMYGRILRGMRSTASVVTNAVLLPALGIIAIGTMLVVGYNQGWVRYITDEVHIIETMLVPSEVVETDAASPLVESITPTPIPTLTPSSTLVPTLTPNIILPQPPSNNPTPAPNINPTPTPKDDKGKHLGQTPTPPPKR